MSGKASLQHLMVLWSVPDESYIHGLHWGVYLNDVDIYSDTPEDVKHVRPVLDRLAKRE